MTHVSLEDCRVLRASTKEVEAYLDETALLTTDFGIRTFQELEAAYTEIKSGERETTLILIRITK